MIYRCATAARQRADPLLGTAAPARRWLLIEDFGGWGTAGVSSSSIRPEVARALTDRAADATARLQLIRRPGRRRRQESVRQYAFVDADSEGAWWGQAHADHQLLDVPLTPEESPGAPRREPIYLVCTHGRKDVCCAIRGRPAAARLASHRPEATWETSHVGGDRFAANLVVLPHGLCYGHLTPDTALAAAKAYENALVLPEQLRGRSTLPTPAQAAECLARRILAESRLHALAMRSVTRLDATNWQVRLARDAGTVRVTVRAVTSPLPAQLTCGNPHAVHYRSFELVSLVAEDGPP